MQRNAFLASESAADLIAIGPSIAFVGEFLGAEHGVLNIRLRTFVDGDIQSILAFNDHYHDIQNYDRYVLVNELGDGRMLSGPLSIKKEGGGSYTIYCPVLPRATRIKPSELPTDIALSPAILFCDRSAADRVKQNLTHLICDHIINFRASKQAYIDGRSSNSFAHYAEGVA
jgi:hypothetical protein